MASLRKTVNATEGPLFSKMFLFAIPLMLTNLIQQLYTVADNMVVGNFSNNANALGAIGSSASVVSFLIALFTGFAIGTEATTSRNFGAKDTDSLSKGVHTSLILSLSVGIAIGTIGFIFARPILEVLNTQEKFIDGAVVYLRIRCLGIPFVALYNSSAAVLRSIGDSKTPFYILTISGLSNILLNLVFVTCLGMDADGVALATVISQVLSVVLVLWILMKRDDQPYVIKLSLLKIDKTSAKRILKFAIPGTVQSSVAHVMNVFIAASANIFSPEVIEARTIASDIDTIVSTIVATYVNVSLTFTGQNRGARKPERVIKTLFCSILQACTIAFVIGQLILVFREPLIALFVDESVYDVSVITEYATTIMTIMLSSYIVAGATNSLSGFVKGLGYSLPPMVVSIIDMGVVRAIWIFGLFPLVKTLDFLYYIYPISWGLNIIIYSGIILFIWKKAKARMIKPPSEVECKTEAISEKN